MRWRTLALICAWTLPSAICLAATAIVYSAFRIAPPVRLDASERTAVMATLRAALRDQPAVPNPVHHPLAGPVAVTVWSRGKQLARVDGTGADLAAATDDAARALRVEPHVRALPVADLEGARVQVDVVTGTGPLAGSLGGGEWLFDHLAIPGTADLFAINPGVDGIAVDLAERSVLLLPHELVASSNLLASTHPTAAIPDFTMGPDLKAIGALLGDRAHAAIDPARLYRFRTDAFVETPSHTAAPLPLYRGLPPAPALTGAALREAALNGGRYLVAHLAPSGRYIYVHDLWTGAQTDPTRIGGDYSMPRHAGATYFLSELYRITKEPWLREPIERAFGHLATLLAQARCAGTLPDGTPFDCVLDRDEAVAHLGSTALAVVAFVEYQRATGDVRYLPIATRLAAWILSMQRSDGSFHDLYDTRTHVQTNDEVLYYSGEAALALARMYLVTSDPKYLTGAQRGLDWLVGWYDFFLGGAFYVEQHWTCIAAEAIWPAVKRDAYLEFCDGFGAFLRRQQVDAGEFPDDADYAGSYNITPFVVPYNAPAGSNTEAMVSTYLLGKAHGSPDPRIAGQVRAALQYVLGQQLRPDSDFDVVGAGDGAMPGTPIDRAIRIDNLQHACSAMIRASEWIDDP